MRVNIRNNETISSVINFINPWEHEKQRQIFSGITLENMLEVKTRTESQKRVRRLVPGRIHKTITQKKNLGKRAMQHKQKLQWKRNFRKKFFLK